MVSSVYLKILKKSIALPALIGALMFALPARAVIPDDPNYPVQAAMWNQINAPMAWEASVGEKRVVVATLDTGADTWHEDLSKNIWVNTGEIPGNGKDDDRNGYVDDINGWNFVENTNDVRTSVFEENQDSEAVRHGTVVAGLIGAIGNNNTNGVGLNWRISVMPLRAVNSEGSGLYSSVTRAIDYAVNNGADIISMSLIGTATGTELKKSLRHAYEMGVVVVAAVGNHQRNQSGDLGIKPIYPACFDENDHENWILGVGSVDNQDKLSYFSNYGHCLDLLAPGENIFSIERYSPQYGFNEDFGGNFKGTSFAAPLVAGAAALIKAIRPDWKADKIIANLLNSADPVMGQNPGQSGLGFGRLNIGQAAAQASIGRPPELPFANLYFRSGQGFERYNLERRFAVPVGGAGEGERAIDATHVGSLYDSKREVAFLVRRGAAFFFATSDRSKWLNAGI